MTRIAIVEDEAAVREQLAGYVQRYTRQYGTPFEVTEFADGMEILEDYRPQFDIIFLDVEMKHLDGMETARRIRERDGGVLIVFITNMAQYAIRGYAVGALDYVLKPVPYFAFSQQLQKALGQLEKRERHYLAVAVDGGMRRLDAAEIYYLESEGHKVHFYTEKEDFVVPGTLKNYEEKLVGRAFARCNSGYLVNLAQVSGVQQDMVQVGPYTLQISRPRRKAFMAELDGVLHRQYEQYKQSKENIRLINRRYHELKMQIAAIRAERDHAKQDVALAAMESGIRQYEAENKTGNPVLDTLLTAKSLYCQQHHITMTCVADGHLLDFLETGEICTIVGTALDNATESVETEPDHEKRLIRVAVYAQNGFVMLRFENYCAQEVELGADGLPRRNTHGGSDLRGVRAAAEKRGGTMTLHWENEWFTLRVLLPQKS